MRMDLTSAHPAHVQLAGQQVAAASAAAQHAAAVAQAAHRGQPGTSSSASISMPLRIDTREAVKVRK
jgi:hypothetical protein